MEVLRGLEPSPVFHFFEELTKIPHGSGNIDKISDYLANFAGSRGFFVIQDEAKNIIITMPATKGREELEPLILQGHMDMVAVKDGHCDIDMTRDSLRLKTDGDTVWAEGTSLGADDGIAVAYFCALMDDPSIPHPELTLLITTDEETGMDGARAIDPSLLKGKRFINIDSEEEGVLLAGCAGGARVSVSLSGCLKALRGKTWRVSITDLRGGHSGQDISKERGNANIIAGRLLNELNDSGINYGIVSLSGGVADNAIPASAQIDVILSGNGGDEEWFLRIIENVRGEISHELGKKDPDLRIDVKSLSETDENVRAAADTFAKNIGALILSLPNGVQAMSADMPDLVETSLNLGMMSLVSPKTADNGVLKLTFAVRSSVESARELLIKRLELIAEAFGAEHETHGRYPGWAYDPDSVICAHFSNVWRTLNGSSPRVEAIHAGVECGLFKEKKPELDCISFGPDLEHVHSTGERLHVASAKRTWEYLKAALEAWDRERE